MVTSTVNAKRWKVWEQGRSATGRPVPISVSVEGGRVKCYVTDADGLENIRSGEEPESYFLHFSGRYFDGYVFVPVGKQWYVAVYNTSSGPVEVTVGK